MVFPSSDCFRRSAQPEVFKEGKIIDLLRVEGLLSDPLHPHFLKVFKRNLELMN
jgi:hypothetical protein